MAAEEADLGTGRTGGRDATTGVIPGRFALSVGCPDSEPPRGWRWTALSSVAQLESGHTPSRKHPEYWGGGIPWIGIKDATENHGRTIFETYQNVSELGLEHSSARLLPAKTVCLSRTASVGFVVVMGRPMATSQDFVNWICGPRILPHFLKYVLLAENEALWRFASGTTHQTIYYPEAKAFHICLPPIGEQEAIAAVLGALDDKIELNRRMNATLEAMARALFQSWFVDFDPVRAKLAGHEPVGMDQATAALFPEQFEESALGHTPKGWHIKRVSDVVEEVFDGPHATPPDAEAGPVFLGIKNLTGSGLDLSDVRHISESDWPRWTKRVTPRPLDIVFSYEATLGFFALIPPGLRCCLGRRLALIRPKAREGHPHFWLHQFIGPDFQRYLMKHSVQGATVDRIPLVHFPNYLVLAPPLPLTQAFESRVAPLWARIHANAEQSGILATLRDTLLPKLLGGELSVAEAAATG